MSVSSVTVPNVDSDDIVDPGDAAIQALLALTAENIGDRERRDRLIDAILTIPPIIEWPPDWLQTLRETCYFLKDLAKQARQQAENGYNDSNEHR